LFLPDTIVSEILRISQQSRVVEIASTSVTSEANIWSTRAVTGSDTPYIRLASKRLCAKVPNQCAFCVVF